MKYIHKDCSNRKIHLGLISRCKKGEKWGLIYGFRVPPYNGLSTIHENKLFYFEKELDTEMDEHTLVSYLSYDYNGFTPEVDYVYPVSSLVLWHDQHKKERSDGIYHDDKVWQLINDGIPYFDYSYGRQYCIYYPIIKENICTIWRGLFGAGIYMNREAHVYEMTRELDRLHYSGWPSIDDVSDEIAKIKVYLDSINAYEIIDTYRIEQRNIYHSKPGGDDSYAETTYWKLQSDDGFLNYLLPTKDELTFFDDNAYPSDGYTEGHFFLEEKTLQARNIAKKEYSKEKHMAFLIRDYFTNIEEKKNRSGSLMEALYDEFDIEGTSDIVNEFRGDITDNIKTLINEYNQSTVRGPLEVHPKK